MAASRRNHRLSNIQGSRRARSNIRRSNIRARRKAVRSPTRLARQAEFSLSRCRLRRALPLLLRRSRPRQLRLLQRTAGLSRRQIHHRRRRCLT
jgi:hypothetical protein